MKKWYLIWTTIFLLACFLRFYRFSARAPFDWDQNRDYQKVASIVSGKLTMLGPIAKGDGGFYLGPLYYYLLVPGYLISHGHPLSFPLTSITIDLITIFSIFYLAHQNKNKRLSLTLVGFFWAFSWFAIENARISWNVSLLPLWIVIMYGFISAHTLSSKKVLFFGIVSALSWHIHASLIPLSLLPIFFIKAPFSPFKKILLFFVGYFVSLLPLIFFDLRHAFFNARLMMNFLQHSSQIPHAPISQAVLDVLAKIGKNSLALTTGYASPNLWVGLLVLCFSFFNLLKKEKESIWLSLMILLNFLFVVLLRDTNFPEYYLAAGFLPLLMLISRSHRLALLFLIVFISNFTAYTYDTTPFALANKIKAVEAVADLKKPVDVRYELAPGREGGLVPLLKLNHIQVVESAPTKIVFTDQKDKQIFIDGELATNILESGGIKVAKYESN